MFEEYQQFILELYRSKIADKDSQLLHELTKPTVANLKKAALKALSQRYRRKDDKILSDFFGSQPDAVGFYEAIRKKDPDGYKAIYRWLRGEIGVTNETNVELFAWLVDFKERPFDPTKDYGEMLKNIRNKNLTGTGGTSEGTTEPIPEEEEEKREKKIFGAFTIRQILIGSIVVLFIAAGGIFLRQYYIASSGPQNCMYWDGKQYQSSSCFIRKDHSVQLIPFDSIKQMHLKRNMHPETLTAYSIGKAGYIRIGGKYEYYTDSGNYPLDTSWHLTKVSAYILNKDYPRYPVN